MAGGPDARARARSAGVLRALCADIVDVRGAVLSSSDGLVVVAEPASENSAEVAAMAAALVALAQQLGSAVVGGRLEDCCVRTASGVVCLVAVTERHVLSVGTGGGVPLGLVLRQSRTAAAVLSRILDDQLDVV
ncbi:MAG: roadblock/LC7 domain-containing protein [Kineosporiaceae bacterium]